MQPVAGITSGLRHIIGLARYRYRLTTVNAGEDGVCFPLSFIAECHVFTFILWDPNFSTIFISQK
jgi:hypothetical protein